MEEGWPTLFLDFMYRWGFLTFQLAQEPRYWNLTKNKLSGPPFRRPNRLFSQSLTSSFWSYLRLICNQISQLWVSPEVSGGCPKSDFDSMNILNTLLKSKGGMGCPGDFRDGPESKIYFSLLGLWNGIWTRAFQLWFLGIRNWRKLSVDEIESPYLRLLLVTIVKLMNEPELYKNKNLKARIFSRIVTCIDKVLK